MFRIALVVLIASAVSAKLISPDGSIPAGSSLGKRLLSMAKVVTPSRHLNNNNGADYSWIAAYSLRYLGCSALVQVSGQNGNNNNNNNNNGQSSSMLYHEQLARFALCPSTSCGTCSGGGEYVLNMATFVDAYTEAQLTALEYACETVRGNCVCNDDTVDDKTCESACYTKANMTKCINYNGNGDQDFEVQRYLECEKMNGGNNNNNNNNNQGNYNGYYYIGPYCSPKDGFSIFLGIFFDAACISHANSTVYAEVNGADLPYANKSMVSSECIDCKKQNNNNNNGYDEAYDSCIELYAASAKCESKMSIANPDTSACDFLSSVLPTLDTASRAVNTGASTSNKSKSGKGAKAFATIFAFTTVVFSAYSYFLYRKIKRGSVDLSSQV